MADTSYQRSIDQAARTLQAANADWQRIYEQVQAIPDTEKGPGGAKEASFADLSKQLDAAAKRSAAAETAYQSAIADADRALAATKEYAPAGEKRQRLDTVNNTLVAVTEVADGRGGWSSDPGTPPSKIDIPGVSPATTTTAAPTSEWILKDGKLEKNPAYKPATPTPGSAVPTSQYVYDANGKPSLNPAYVKPPVNAEINTTAEYINDPANPGQLIKNPNYKAPAPAPMTPGETARDKAAAGTAQGTADAALRKAIADADKAEADLKNAQTAARQAPTDQQAQQAIQNALRNQDLARQQLEQAMAQAGNLNPTLVDQAKATLANTKVTTESTQAGIQKDKLGDLYGLQDKIKQVRDLIASGEIKPAQGDQMIAAAQRGTNIYDVLKQEQSDRSTARSQDINSKNQQLSTYGSMANSGLNTFQEMNKTGAIGSDATGKAYLGMLEMARQSVRDYAPAPAQQADYLGGNVSGLVNQAQQQIAPTPAMPSQPAAPASSAQPITINIGSGAASNPQPQMAAPGPSGPYSSGGLGPVAAGNGGDMLASMAARQTPASKGEVLQTLFPNVAKKYGLGTM